MAYILNHQAAFAAWRDHTSAVRLETDSYVQELLREAYPDFCITRTSPSKCDLLGYAEAGYATAIRKIEDGSCYDATRVYRLPPSRLDETTPGKLEDVVNFGRWEYQWDGSDFVVYEVLYVNRFSQVIKLLYVLAPQIPGIFRNGYHGRIDDLLLASGKWTRGLHKQIWVFDNQQWAKNKGLWENVQEATWADVILDTTMKSKLIQDVQGFFDSRDLYQKSKVPWKRGVIFHGVPGNGKTMSIKALINSLGTRSPPVPSLYVKSLDACSGPKWSIRQIFQKARREAPCLLILEDLDTLVGENTRSYFLNEVDGLQSNDGILMIGTTNHIDRLDPAVTKRPSRFDRKYHFKSPSEDERLAYCHYWRDKFVESDTVEFPAEICPIVSKLTEGFSFAYLKELFITSLLVLAHGDFDKSEIAYVAAGVEADSKIPKRPIPVVEVQDVDQDNLLLKTIESQVQVLLEEIDHAAKESSTNDQKVASNAAPIQYRLPSPLDDGDDV